MTKFLAEREVLFAEHDIIGEALEWSARSEEASRYALNYIHGAHNMALAILGKINGDATNE